MFTTPGVEPIGIAKRSFPGLATQIFFAIGYMLMAGVAYAIRDFVWTNFVMSILPIVMVSYYWLVVKIYNYIEKYYC